MDRKKIVVLTLAAIMAMPLTAKPVKAAENPNNVIENINKLEEEPKEEPMEMVEAMVEPEPEPEQQDTGDKTSKQYKYTIIYKCGDEELGREDGEGELGSDILVYMQEFIGYQCNVSPDLKKVTENEGDNVVIVNYEKVQRYNVFKDEDGNVIKKSPIEEEIVYPVITKEPTAEASYKLISWEAWTTGGDVYFKPVFKKILNKYKYTVVYRCGDTELEREEGEADYGSEIPANVKKFDGYKYKSSSEAVKITENLEGNVVYVDYEEDAYKKVKEDINKEVYTLLKAFDKAYSSFSNIINILWRLFN